MHKVLIAVTIMVVSDARATEYCGTERMAFQSEQTVLRARGYIACLEYELAWIRASGVPPTDRTGGLGLPTPRFGQGRRIEELWSAILRIQAAEGMDDAELKTRLSVGWREFDLDAIRNAPVDPVLRPELIPDDLFLDIPIDRFNGAGRLDMRR